MKLRGNAAHPFSAGELCPKVNRFLDRVYSPDRILTPLRRVGPKGSGEFEPISWADALAETAERLHGVIAAHGPEAVLPFSDAGNQSLLSMMGLSGRFFGHMGASLIDRNICGPTVGAGMRMTNGTGRGMDALELEHSQLILLWGTNTKLTNRHLWPTIETARSRGARIVVIDPIRTATAEAIDADRGDRFIQPLPGTDIAMMLAMMHVIIRDGLTNDEWIAEHTLGYDELREAVADWTPERASVVSGVDADTITSLATDYATTRPAGIRTVIGAEHHENGGDVLPHARLSARADGCLGRTRRRHRQECRVVQRRPHRRRHVHPPGSRAGRGTSRTADVEHEPARRHPHRPDTPAAARARASTHWSCGTRTRSSSCPTPS